MKNYVVYVSWHDDLSFNYIYSEKRTFDNKSDADEYVKYHLKRGFNVKVEKVAI